MQDSLKENLEGIFPPVEIDAFDPFPECDKAESAIIKIEYVPHLNGGLNEDEIESLKDHRKITKLQSLIDSAMVPYFVSLGLAFIILIFGAAPIAFQMMGPESELALQGSPSDIFMSILTAFLISAGIIGFAISFSRQRQIRRENERIKQETKKVWDDVKDRLIRVSDIPKYRVDNYKAARHSIVSLRYHLIDANKNCGRYVGGKPEYMEALRLLSEWAKSLETDPKSARAKMANASTIKDEKVRAIGARYLRDKEIEDALYAKLQSGLSELNLVTLNMIARGEEQFLIRTAQEQDMYC